MVLNVTFAVIKKKKNASFNIVVKYVKYQPFSSVGAYDQHSIITSFPTLFNKSGAYALTPRNTNCTNHIFIINVVKISIINVTKISILNGRLDKFDRCGRIMLLTSSYKKVNFTKSVVHASTSRSH